MPNLDDYSPIVSAVSYKELQKLNLAKSIKHVFIDVKAVLRKDSVDARL